MWRHPRDRSSDCNTLAYWQNLACIAERGLFDGIFLADILGVYDVFQGTAGPAIAHPVQDIRDRATRSGRDALARSFDRRPRSS